MRRSCGAGLPRFDGKSKSEEPVISSALSLLRGGVRSCWARPAWPAAEIPRPIPIGRSGWWSRSSPGGATDTLARQITNDLQGCARPVVVVENRPGASGYLAWNHVATSEPDGYTLLLAENALGISQALHKKATSSFDPLTQYDAIARGRDLAARRWSLANNVPANTVAELVAYSRTVPQKMNFASAGVGSVSHLNFEVFKDARRHGGRPHSLQGRRPGDERRDRRPRRR